MTFNESHPIRATITIIYKKKYKKIKEEFENKLRNNCNLYTADRERKGILKLMGLSDEFYEKYDIIGKIGTTAQFSYIIKENIGDALRTSFDIFNNKDHIKKHIQFIKDLLKKTINENKNYALIIRQRAYKLKLHYSINNVNFTSISFGKIMLHNLPLLLGWFITPINRIINEFCKTQNDINIQNSIDIGNRFYLAISKITLSEVIITAIFIIFIYFIISLINWGANRNVIKF